jgi:hypothetical protein
MIKPFSHHHQSPMVLRDDKTVKRSAHAPLSAVTDKQQLFVEVIAGGLECCGCVLKCLSLNNLLTDRREMIVHHQSMTPESCS